MAASLCKEIEYLSILERFLPALDYLTLAYIPQRLISSLDCLKFVPQHVSEGWHQIG